MMQGSNPNNSSSLPGEIQSLFTQLQQAILLCRPRNCMTFSLRYLSDERYYLAQHNSLSSSNPAGASSLPGSGIVGNAGLSSLSGNKDWDAASYRPSHPLAMVMNLEELHALHLLPFLFPSSSSSSVSSDKSNQAEDYFQFLASYLYVFMQQCYVRISSQYPNLAISGSLPSVNVVSGASFSSSTNPTGNHPSLSLPVLLVRSRSTPNTIAAADAERSGSPVMTPTVPGASSNNAMNCNHVGGSSNPPAVGPNYHITGPGAYFLEFIDGMTILEMLNALDLSVYKLYCRIIEELMVEKLENLKQVRFAEFVSIIRLKFTLYHVYIFLKDEVWELLRTIDPTTIYPINDSSVIDVSKFKSFLVRKHPFLTSNSKGSNDSGFASNSFSNPPAVTHGYHYHRVWQDQDMTMLLRCLMAVLIQEEKREGQPSLNVNENLLLGFDQLSDKLIRKFMTLLS